jgi:hypothetical protein
MAADFDRLSERQRQFLDEPAATIAWKTSSMLSLEGAANPASNSGGLPLRFHELRRGSGIRRKLIDAALDAGSGTAFSSTMRR